MTLDDLLARLDGVRSRGSRWSAKCPGHADRCPSLSVSAGDKGILLRCWSGCSLREICTALGIRETELFFDALDTDPRRRREAAQQRARDLKQKMADAQKQGRRIDALREADYHIRSRCGLDIGGWSDQKLDEELHLLADANALLASEEYE